MAPQYRNANNAHSAASLAPGASRPWLLAFYAFFICGSLAFILTIGVPRLAEESRHVSAAGISMFSAPPQLDMQDANVWHTYVNLASKYINPSHYQHIVADAPALSQATSTQSVPEVSPVSGAAIGGERLAELRATTFDTANWNSTSTATAPSCATWASEWLTARFNSAPSTSTSPALVRKVLNSLMVNDFPPALRRVAPFLAGPVSLSGFLNTASSCSMGNQAIIAFLCEWHSSDPNLFSLSSATGLPWSGSSLVEILTFMALVDRLATSARDDHVFAADLLFHVSSRFAASGGTDRFYSDALPYKTAGLADFVRDKFEAVQLAQIMKNMARVGVGRRNGAATGSPSPFGTVPWSSATPSLTKAHLLQLNLLEASYQQVDSLPSNAQTGLALAWNLQRRHVLSEILLHEAGNHDQRMALTKDWVDGYINWNGVFILEKFQFLPAASILFLPSIICVNDELVHVPGFSASEPATEGIGSGNWIITRGYSLYLMLVYASTPNTLDMYVKKDGNLTNIVNTWSTQTLLNSHFDVPTASEFKEMAAWFPSIVSPLVHLSPLGRRMLLTFAVFGSVAIAAMCLEYATAYHLLRWTSGGRKQHGAVLTGWKLAEGLFPLALCISVYSRAWWAPLLLVVGLWKLGFPEVTAAMINSIPHATPATTPSPNHQCLCKIPSTQPKSLTDHTSHPLKASNRVEKDTMIRLTQIRPPAVYVLLCSMQFLDGWGTLLHHLSVSWYVCASVTGLVDTSEFQYMAMTVPLVFMHWATLLQYRSRFLFGIVELGLEIWFEMEIFTNLQFCLYYHEQRCIWGMLFAHWCLWAAGLTNYFLEQYYRFREVFVDKHKRQQGSGDPPVIVRMVRNDSVTDLKSIPTIASMGQSTTNLKATPNDDINEDATVITILPFVATAGTTPEDRSVSPPEATNASGFPIVVGEASSVMINQSKQEAVCSCEQHVRLMEVDTRPSKIWHFRQAARRLHVMSPHTINCDDDEDPRAARDVRNTMHND